MKLQKYTWLLLFPALIASAFAVTSFMNAPGETEQNTGSIKWMTLEEVQAAQKKEPRLVIVDLYTTWCVWCTKMESSTFSDATLANYINKNFYALKFDAEGSAPVTFNGKTYELTNINNRNVHQLAWEWGNVNNRIGYPTIVVLDEKMNKLQTSPGFKDADAMEALVKFYGDKIYKTKSWQDYISSGR